MPVTQRHQRNNFKGRFEYPQGCRRVRFFAGSSDRSGPGDRFRRRILADDVFLDLFFQQLALRALVLEFVLDRQPMGF